MRDDVNTFVSDEPETRDAWWEEIRQEIKSHAKALGCHAVVGYKESTSIWYLNTHTHTVLNSEDVTFYTLVINCFFGFLIYPGFSRWLN